MNGTERITCNYQIITGLGKIHDCTDEAIMFYRHSAPTPELALQLTSVMSYVYMRCNDHGVKSFMNWKVVSREEALCYLVLNE